jgi:hypothetical protein
MPTSTKGALIKTVGRRALEVRPDGKNVMMIIWIERGGKYRSLAKPVLPKAEAKKLRDELDRVLKLTP